MNDIIRNCIDCGEDFTITIKEQRYFKSLNYDLPKRCKACRNKRGLERKAIRDAEEAKIRELENEKRRIQREQEEKILLDELTKTPFNLISEPVIDEDTLVIIGNGFDLAHSIPSSYYSFKDNCKGQVKDALEFFIDCEDIWADFENNLAYLDREKVIWSMWENKSLNDVLDEDDEDFSAADFFMSIEDGGWGISSILNELPKSFRRWINSLDVNKEKKYNLSENAKYLNFNYTETLETVYSVPKNQITYIHGDRRNKKDVLVLGHGHDIEKVYDEWYSKNKDRKEFQPYRYGRKGRRFRNDNPVYLAYFLKDESKGNWHSQTNYDYISTCVRMIEDYYDESAKKTDEIINKYSEYFASLKDIKRIVTLGHSLSDVDIPYLRKIRENVPNAKWQIGFHSLRDYHRIVEVVDELELDNVEIFQS